MCSSYPLSDTILYCMARSPREERASFPRRRFFPVAEWPAVRSFVPCKAVTMRAGMQSWMSMVVVWAGLILNDCRLVRVVSIESFPQLFQHH